MPNFTPPRPWHDSLIRSALFVAERKFTSTQPEDPGQDDELLAHRARVFVEAINRMPVEQQPANWVVADDPNAKAAWLNEKVQFLADFNRELGKENEKIRKEAEATTRLLRQAEAEIESLLAKLGASDARVQDLRKQLKEVS